LGRKALDHPEIIVTGRSKLYRAVGLGPKSLQEVAELLYEYGYIDDVENWFGS
jgi:hypothetical protein